MRFLKICLLCLLLSPLAASAIRGETMVLEADFERITSQFRPLHGVNKGPLAPGELIDLTEFYRQAGIPFTRLHDCHWPNPDVVDIHVLFPDFEADPAKIGSYRFGETDQYLERVKATGSGIIFRLGESIEHTKIKRFVHPPKSAEKWAAICLGVIRHYNEGWGDGFRFNIKYWEIWNEPENRPTMWTGNDEQFFQLYKTASRAIKNQFPDVKVGGPAIGASGQFVTGEFIPTSFCSQFLALCQKESLPLDFFSWHCYTDDPRELARRCVAIRRLLDQSGFSKTESHLNEWNYLPGKSWAGLSKTSLPFDRQKFYEEMWGLPGASFIASSLIEMQTAPVDLCNLFHGELGGFGLFNEFGVPMKSFHALRAFNQLYLMKNQVEVKGVLGDGVSIAAGVNGEKSAATILIAKRTIGKTEFEIGLNHLSSSRSWTPELFILDQEQNMEKGILEKSSEQTSRYRLVLEGPSIGLVKLVSKSE